MLLSVDEVDHEEAVVAASELATSQLVELTHIIK
jgi:hypothetical protein